MHHTVTLRRISAAEAEAHGLPRLGLALEHDGTWLSSPFPEPGAYLHMSGPPGGPLSFSLLAYQGEERPETLMGAVQAQAAQRGWRPLLLGTPETLTLAGGARLALGFLAHESLARTRYAAVLLPAPRLFGSAPHGVLVLFGHGQPSGDDTACATTASHPALHPVLRSLHLTR